MKQSTISFLLLVVIYFAFISLGLPDSIFGIAWPYMSVDFSRALETAGIVTISMTICAAISSVMSGYVLAKFGTGRVTFISCLMTATGLVGYSIAPSFLWLIPFVPLLGFGAGSIDCGLNIFVSAHYSSRHMNWLHCCWGIGATLGPVIMTAFVAGNADWRGGYRTVGLIQFSLAIILFLTLGLWAKVKGSGDGADGEGAIPDATGTEAELRGMRARAIWMQIAIYVVYTSCEFIVGLWAFTLLTKFRGVAPAYAGAWVSVYYGSLTVSRFLSGFVVNRLGNRVMIRTGLIASLAGIVLFAFQFFFPGASPITALAGLVLIGGGFGPVFPCMTHETSRRFRDETARKVIGFQAAGACIGGATFPALVGWVGVRTTFEILPFTVGVLVALTLFITIALDRQTSKGKL